MNRLLFVTEPLVIYRYRGIEILADHRGGDSVGIRESLVTDMYRSLLLRLRYGEDPINILDLGANAGGFVLLCKASGLRLSKVVCVEMNPAVCERLRFNLDRNLSGVARCINAAVVGTARTLELRLGSGSTGDSIYREPGLQTSGRLCRVQGRTLDDIIETEFRDGTIDLCKMDVEGAEYEVLVSGPAHNRLRQFRHLIIELHTVPGMSRDSVHKALASRGFSAVAASSAVPSVYLFENTRSP